MVRLSKVAHELTLPESAGLGSRCCWSRWNRPLDHGGRSPFFIAHQIAHKHVDHLVRCAKSEKEQELLELGDIILVCRCQGVIEYLGFVSAIE